MYSYILYVFLKINLDKKNKGKQYLEREFKKKIMGGHPVIFLTIIRSSPSFFLVSQSSPCNVLICSSLGEG